VVTACQFISDYYDRSPRAQINNVRVTIGESQIFSIQYSFSVTVSLISGNVSGHAGYEVRRSVVHQALRFSKLNHSDLERKDETHPFMCNTSPTYHGIRIPLNWYARLKKAGPHSRPKRPKLFLRSDRATGSHARSVPRIPAHLPMPICSRSQWPTVPLSWYQLITYLGLSNSSHSVLAFPTYFCFYNTCPAACTSESRLCLPGPQLLVVETGAVTRVAGLGTSLKG